MPQPNDSEDFSHRKNNKLLVQAVTLVVVDFYKVCCLHAVSIG